MEWTVNELLPDEITRVDSSLTTEPMKGDAKTVRMMQDSLCKVIDNLGEQSSAAQGLKKVITTGEKLRNNPKHFLYLLKDEYANDNAGEAIGMLKMGRKHLYLVDPEADTHEMEPLCVLDFFVVPSHRRHGYGKYLFEYMLQDTDSDAHALAIDGPSQVMQRFLCTNYDFTAIFRQTNNFATSSQFFKFNHDGTISTRKQREIEESTTNQEILDETQRARLIVNRPQLVGRFAAQKPKSCIAEIIHGFVEPKPKEKRKIFRAYPNWCKPYKPEDWTEELLLRDQAELAAKEAKERAEAAAAAGEGAEDAAWDEGPEDAVGAEGAEDAAGIEESEDVAGTEEPEDTSGAEGPEDAAGTEGPEDAAGTEEPEDTAGAEGPVDAEGTEEPEDTAGAEGSDDDVSVRQLYDHYDMTRPDWPKDAYTESDVEVLEDRYNDEEEDDPDYDYEDEEPEEPYDGYDAAAEGEDPAQSEEPKEEPAVADTDESANNAESANKVW